MFERFQRLAHRVLRMVPTEFGLDTRQGHAHAHAQALVHARGEVEAAPSPDVSSVMSLKWRFLAAQESARPGFMTLRAVREGGQVVDFVWDFVSAAAARMLHDDCAQCEGRRLRTVFAGHGEVATLLFEQYRRVVENGAAEATQQLHRVDRRHDTFRHGAVRLGDGVAVTLINLSAGARATALAAQLAEQQKSSRRSAPYRPLAGNSR